jgi:DNA mismatch repair protein MutS
MGLSMSGTPTAEGATPALAQWFAAKAAQPDALVFFRMGDFFELFFADAEAASQALDLALTYRGEHQGRPVPMCGVPVHAHEIYLARLIRRGFRVALCEQIETPEEAKARRATTIRREIVRLVTPGTATEEALLEAARPAWLLALVEAGAAWLDVSTGAFETAAGEDIAALLARLEPAEILCAEALAAHPALAGRCPVVQPVPRDAAQRLAALFNVASLEGFGSFTSAEAEAALMAVDYARAAQNWTMPRLSPPSPQGAHGILAMDAATRRSLEILGPGASLFSAIDHSLTGAGARELAARLGAPLTERSAIEERQDAVAALIADARLRAALRGALRGAPDMARALARFSLDRQTPRDFGGLRDGLQRGAAMA